MSDARVESDAGTPTIRALLDQAGEEIVAGNPFRALGCINSAIALLDNAEKQMRRGYDEYDGNWKPLPTGIRLVPDPDPEASS